MDFYVGIASYKRPEASRTLDYLDSLGFPKERRILSVQTEEDRDAYTRSGLSERVGTFLYREASTAAGNRNTILLNVPEGTNVVFMDDDIKQVVMEDLGLVPLDTLEKFEHYSKGGCEDAWKDKSGVIRVAELLVAKYPDILKLNPKRPGEVLMVKRGKR